jgi:hypothetical protein
MARTSASCNVYGDAETDEPQFATSKRASSVGT